MPPYTVHVYAICRVEFPGVTAPDAVAAIRQIIAQGDVAERVRAGAAEFSDDFDGFTVDVEGDTEHHQTQHFEGDDARLWRDEEAHVPTAPASRQPAVAEAVDGAPPDLADQTRNAAPRLVEALDNVMARLIEWMEIADDEDDRAADFSALVDGAEALLAAGAVEPSGIDDIRADIQDWRAKAAELAAAEAAAEASEADRLA